MLLQNSLDLFLSLNLIFWVVNIILTLFIIVYIVYKVYLKKNKAYRKEMGLNLYNLITWLIFLGLVLIANILTVLFRFAISEPDLIYLLERISITLVYIAILIKVIFLEYLLNKLKHYKGFYFSVISLITLILILLVDPSKFIEIGLLQAIILVFVVLDYSFLPLLYFILSIKSKGETRMKAFQTSAGAVFLGLGLFFRPSILEGYYGISELLDMLINYTYITSPISIIIAMILIFNSFRSKEVS